MGSLELMTARIESIATKKITLTFVVMKTPQLTNNCNDLLDKLIFNAQKQSLLVVWFCLEIHILLQTLPWELMIYP